MITVTIRVPDSIRALMLEAPDAPPGPIGERDIHQYCVGLLCSALAMLPPTGATVSREFRALNEDHG